MVAKVVISLNPLPSSCENCRGHFYIDFTRFLAFDAKRGGWVGLELSVDMTLRFAKIDM